jgi:DNA/RNA-binding domain of Phe-tRNA-synthetase-like protein
MQIEVNWSKEVTENSPELSICIGTIINVYNETENEKIKQLRKTVYEEARTKYNIETLKDDPTVRAFRDFYWKLNIDPTKTRPSGEALLRRVLHGEELPHTSTVVDTYNLASLKTIIPISGFDADQLSLPFRVRFAQMGETFTGIGMAKPLTLTDKMLVLADERQILCIYPYRDCDHTKITLQTRNVMIVGYGTPATTKQQLREAVETTLSLIKQVSSGEIEMTKAFSSSEQ